LEVFLKMRVSRFAALAGFAVLLSACGGADRQAHDMAQDPLASAAPVTTAAAPDGGTATAAPITGTVHEVRMLGDERGYRYEPANITVRAGDGIRFINVNGFPHDVSFAGENIPAAGRAQLMANMPDQRAELTSQLFLQPNETYTISFANVAPGQYPFHCTPHLAMNMRGVITVQ
jgi:plastocyanin